MASKRTVTGEHSTAIPQDYGGREDPHRPNSLKAQASCSQSLLCLSPSLYEVLHFPTSPLVVPGLRKLLWPLLALSERSF